MKREETDVKLIERFRTGKLSENESKLFHKRLLEEEVFAEKVRLQLNVTEEINTFWVNELLLKFEKWEDSLKQVSEKVKANQEIAKPKESARKKKSLIGVIVIALVGLVALIWYLSLPEPADLFIQNFEPYEDVIQNHSAENSDLLTLAMVAYSEEDYAVAMITLKHFLNEVDSISPENRTSARFYLAVSNLGNGNVHTAKQAFEIIAADESNPFQEQADWYIALANIKINNITKAKIQLSKIKSERNHRYQKEARALFKTLE